MTGREMAQTALGAGLFGGVGFGLWQQNVGAGIFMSVVLVFALGLVMDYSQRRGRD